MPHYLATVSAYCLDCLSTMRSRYTDTLPAPFDQFKVWHGKLWTPEGLALTPGDLRAFPVLADLQREINRLRAAPAQYFLKF